MNSNNKNRLDTKSFRLKFSLSKLPSPPGKPACRSFGAGRGWGWGFLFFFSILTGFAQQTTELNNWKFKTGDNPEWVKPGLDDSFWETIQPGRCWELQGHEGYEGYAWYRVKFSLSSGIKTNGLFNDSVRIILGRIDDCDQAFLNGKPLGLNGKTTPENSAGATVDLTKTGYAYHVDRRYTLAVNDPRLQWDRENVLAVRVYNYYTGGGLYTLPVDVRMRDLSDYLLFDVDSKALHTKADGTLIKTIILKNNAPLPELKGRLTVEFIDPANKKTVTRQTREVVLKRSEEATLAFNFEGDALTPMKSTYTFTEAKTGSKVVLTRDPEGNGGWVKYENNPILGGHLGVFFDVNLSKKDDGTFLMYSGWRNERSIAVAESKDGLKWEKPEVCLRYIENSSWENEVNRPLVIHKDGKYQMWYTGETWYSQADGIAAVGYAESDNGETWKRYSDKPVLAADVPWEKGALRCADVMWDEQEKVYKMWYSAGEAFEPDAIGYATSKDGIHWEKDKNNPVFHNDKNIEWERGKVAGCQVIKRENDYLMFYIGYMYSWYAQIGMARSKDGITNWERYQGNPIVKLGMGWDANCVYKPYAVPDPKNNRWLLYYNGRSTDHEQIGVAIHKGMNLGF